MPEWITFRLPKELNQELESFVDTNQAKKMGVRNKTQLLIKISRDFLQNPDQTYEIKRLQEDSEKTKNTISKLNDKIKKISESEQLAINTIDRNKTFAEEQQRQKEELKKDIRQMKLAQQRRDEELKAILEDLKSIKNQIK